jgi:hypothetical protein
MWQLLSHRAVENRPLQGRLFISGFLVQARDFQFVIFGGAIIHKSPCPSSGQQTFSASYADQLLSHTEIVSCGPQRHSDLGKAETS